MISSWPTKELTTKVMATLYLMMGYPGAGKTTTAEVVEKLTGAVHLSSDKLRLQIAPQPTFSTQEHDELYAKLNQMTEDLLKKVRTLFMTPT